jgi:hypothetical protein
VVAAIKNGLAAGDTRSADFTASTVVEEAFSKTAPYFRALRAFRAGLRATRARAGNSVIGRAKQK